MANDWFVKINNAERGPLSPEALKQLAVEGKVTPDSFLKKGASGTWLRASHVKGLFPMAAGQPVAATAQPSPKPVSPPWVPPAKREYPAAPDKPIPPPSAVVKQNRQAIDECLVPEACRQTGSKPPAQNRIPTGSSSKASGSGSSLIYLATAGSVLVAVAVVATLWATGLFSHSRSVPPDSSSATPPTKPICVVKGEIFVTTRSGDVKKAAGLNVSFIPVTEDFRQSLRKLLSEASQIEADFDRYYQATHQKDEPGGGSESHDSKFRDLSHRLKVIDETTKNLMCKDKASIELRDFKERSYFPQIKGLNEAAKKLLAKDPYQTVTGGDGTFLIELPAGDYLLLTEQVEILSEPIMWCKAVTAVEKAGSIIVNQKSATFGKSGDGFSDFCDRFTDEERARVSNSYITPIFMSQNAPWHLDISVEQILLMVATELGIIH